MSQQTAAELQRAPQTTGRSLHSWSSEVNALVRSAQVSLFGKGYFER